MTMAAVLMVAMALGTGCAGFAPAEADMQRRLQAVDVETAVELGKVAVDVYAPEWPEADKAAVKDLLDGVVEFKDGKTTVEVVRGRLPQAVAVVQGHINEGQPWNSEAKLAAVGAIVGLQVVLADYPEAVALLDDLKRAVLAARGRT